MANRITQYQAKAEVRPFQGSFQERTTPDKWLGVEYLPFGNALAKASALVVLAVTTAFAFVPVTTAPVAPAVSAWHPAIEQPIRAVRNQYLTPSYFAPDRQPLPRVDSWHPAVEQPQFDKRRAQYEYASSFAPEQQPQPRVDSWYQQASEPVRTGADKRVRWLGDSDLQLTATQQPERVSVDKFDPGTQQPRFDIRRQQYTLEWSSYDPQPFPDKVFADRWWQQPNQPQFDVRRLQYLAPSFFGPDRQPQPRLDSWWQQTSEPVRLPDRRVQWQGLSVLGVPPSEDAEEVSPDRWQPNPNQPQFDVKRLQHLYPSYAGPDRQPDVRLDSWWQQASEPARLPDRHIQSQGISVLGVPPAEDVEEVSPDRWQPLGNQPQFDLRRNQHLYPSLFSPDLQPQPRLDSWFQPASEPVRLGDSRIQRLGASELDLTPAQDTERTTADKWHPLTNQPLFDVRRAQYTFEFSFFNPQPFPSPVFADKWWQQASEPVRLPDRRIQAQGASEVARTPAEDVERTNPDKWLPAIEQPLTRAVSRAYLADLSSTPFITRAVSVDSWFQQASEPVRPAPSRRHLSEFAVSGNGAAERVSAEKWLPLGNQPQFSLARNQYLYPNYFGPDRQPTVALDWYQQPNQPVFDVRRTQYLDPSSFAPERQPVPPITSWWQVPNQPRFDIRREQYLAPSSILPERIRESLTIDKWWQQPNQPQFDQPRLQYGYQFAGFWPYPLFPQVGRIATSLSSSAALVGIKLTASTSVSVLGQSATVFSLATALDPVLTSATATVTTNLIPDN